MRRRGAIERERIVARRATAAEVFGRYSRAVEVYPRSEAAERAGVSLEDLDRLVELEILKPDADDRLSEGDVRRVGVVQQLEAAGIPLEVLAQTLQIGAFTLDFMDDPAYVVFASYSGETSARTRWRSSRSSSSSSRMGSGR